MEGNEFSWEEPMRKKNPGWKQGDANPNLAPMVDRIIREEFGKVLGDLETMIAERVREQLWIAIGDTLKSKAPAPAPAPVAATPPKKVARAAAPAPRAAVRKGPGRPRGIDKPCSVLDCVRPHRSQGYCAAHYQSARKYDWPKPCPEGFEPPIRKRGRPVREAPEQAPRFVLPDDGITDLKSLFGE